MTDILPHSVANEEAVLGAALMDAEVIGYVNLEPADFYIERHQLIWGVMLDLRQAGGAMDYVTLCTELNKRGLLSAIGGSSHITGLLNACPTTLNAPTYAANIREDAARRRTIFVAQSILQGALDRTHPVQDFLPDRIDDLSRTAMLRCGGAVPWTKFLGDLHDEVTEAYLNPPEYLGIPTGIYDFDRITGGLIPGEEMKLAGEPGIGKSMLAMQMVVFAAMKGFPGACYHMEMRGRAVARRVIAKMGQFSTMALRSGRISADEYTRFGDIIAQAEKYLLYMSDDTDWTTRTMRLDLERLMNKGIRWVLVDYEGLFCDDLGQDDTTRSKQISSRLHAMIKDLGLAGLVIDDMNKEGIKGGGKGQASLAGSARKIYDADSIWMLRKNDKPGVVDLVSEKLREGEEGSSRIVSLQRVPGVPEFRNMAKL